MTKLRSGVGRIFSGGILRIFFLSYLSPVSDTALGVSYVTMKYHLFIVE